MNAPDLNHVRGDLSAIFKRVFADDGIVLRDDMTAADIDGWDSLGHINLIIAVEKSFKIRFTTAEISRSKADGQNIGTFMQLIVSKLGR